MLLPKDANEALCVKNPAFEIILSLNLSPVYIRTG